MSKRDTVDTDLSKNDRTNDTSIVLRKKIKVEHDYILSKAKRINESIDLTDHEVNKFLIIFHTLLDTVDLSSEISEVEETDGIVTDIILKIVLKITELIRQNIDSLPLPKILKDTLKVIKELFNGNKLTQDSRGGQWRQNLRNVPARQAAAAKQPAAAAIPAPPPPPPLPPVRPLPQAVVQHRARARSGRARRGRVQGAIPVGRRPIREGGHGEKNIDEAFIRNRGKYKIKRFLPVSKNVEVKRRGVTVRRMVARRQAIYPALRQQRKY